MTALLSAVGFASDAPAVRKALVSAAARKEPVLVADRGGVVGLLAWTIVPDIVVGAIGRISVVVVNEDDRRRGIGRALFDAVVAELGKHKVGRIEGMSDIEIRNANGFFRSIGLKQASYRFVSKI
jgi:ribosomal protein S18 acetylase RimI-like enzyme